MGWYTRSLQPSSVIALHGLVAKNNAREFDVHHLRFKDVDMTVGKHWRAPKKLGHEMVMGGNFLDPYITILKTSLETSPVARKLPQLHT